MAEQDNLNNYDDEPVAYCAGCYSLKIKYEDTIDSDCCMECGCTDIREAPFEVWEKMYEQRYGHKYAEKSNDPRKNPIFKMSVSKLMNKVSESNLWQKFTHVLYPKFPGGLSKADSIILLFSKLAKDNRMDELRLLLMKHIKI